MLAECAEDIRPSQSAPSTLASLAVAALTRRLRCTHSEKVLVVLQCDVIVHISIAVKTINNN
jgi:hypothetical protein